MCFSIRLDNDGESHPADIAQLLSARALSQSVLTTNERLFDRRTVRSTYDLPNFISDLASKLPGNASENAARLASDHTLLPYYSYMLPKERRETGLSALLNGSDSLHASFGLLAFIVPPVSSLRYCLECLDLMLGREGELWWRRAHHLPGVLVCQIHGTPLRDTGLSFWTKGQHGFVAAVRAVCPVDRPPLVSSASKAILDQLKAIADRSVEFLVGKPEFDDVTEITAAYRSRLYDIDMMLSPKMVDVQKLQNAFRQFYAGVIQLFPDLIDDDGSPGSWLLSLSRSQRKSFHPMLHILFQLFIEGMPKRHRPFGTGPWMCRNPIAGHGDVPTVREVIETKKNDGMQGLFQCDCGFAYTMSVDHSGRLRGPRYKQFGPMLNPALRALVSKGKSLRECANHLGIHTRVVAAAAAELGLNAPWTPAVRAKRATDWDDMLLPFEREVSPRRGKPRPPRSTYKRVDWAAIDREMVERVRKANKEIRSRLPPVRVSLLQLEKTIEKPNLIYNRRDRLPLTMALVERVAETTPEFQQRRIHAVIRRLQMTGRPVLTTPVLREAGVGREWLPLITKLLSQPFPKRRAPRQ